MKPETLREWLDAEINDYYDGSVFGEKNEFDDMLYADIDKDDPTGPTMWVGIRYLKDYMAKKLGDATVYCECPECGGSRKCQRCDGEGKWFYELELAMIDCDDCKGTGTCPACADAPTAIVETSLRRRAKDALWVLEDTADLMPAEAWLDAAVDAVLSTVLGRPVRYAERIQAGPELNMDSDEFVVVDVPQGQDIAILEEAGKEGDK